MIDFKDYSRRGRQAVARWLLDGVRLKDQKYGDNTITICPTGVGDVIRWSGSRAATQAGEIGMDVTTGIPSVFNGGSAKSLALAADASVVKQVVTATFSAVATGTTVTPVDDTIPTITEGDQFMTITLTPEDATSTLDIALLALGSTSVALTYTVALHRDGGAAIAAVSEFDAGATGLVPTNLRWSVSAAAASSTTFTVRIGVASAGTYTFNGQAGGRVFGGVAASYISVVEWKN